MTVKSLSRSSLENNVFYRSMLAGNPGEQESDMLLQEVVLASPTSSVTLSGLSQYASQYKHLQIRMVVASDRNSYPDFMFMRVNGETSSTVYNDHRLEGNGSSVGAGSDLDLPQGIFWGTFPTTPYWGSAVFCAWTIDVLDAYSTTKFKTFRSLAGYTGYQNGIGFRSGLYKSVNIVDSITFRSNLASFVTGSRFSIYGIRG